MWQIPIVSDLYIFQKVKIRMREHFVNSVGTKVVVVKANTVNDLLKQFVIDYYFLNIVKYCFLEVS